MRLGVMIEGQEGITWDKWMHVIELTDRLGFDSLWRSDHLFSVMGVSDRPALALWPSLAVVPLESKLLQFGQLVSPTTFREPVHLAQDAVSLDRLSGGRYWLGLGAGWNVGEHEAFGFALPPLKDRMDRLEEALEVITLLWSGERVSYDGRFFQLHDAQMQPTPLNGKRVPLMLGGSGEKRLLNMVARFADEWNATSMPAESYAHKVSVLDDHCRRVGRDPQTIARSLMLSYIIGSTKDELRARATWLGKFVPSLKDRSPDEILKARRDNGSLVGTPDEIVEQLGELNKLGVSRVMLQTLDVEDDRALQLMAKEVMPRVEQWGRG